MPLSLSTLADGVGACSAVLWPLFERLQAHVLAAERLHGDDTTVPVLAKGKTDTGRSWVYVRDDRPFAEHDPPAAIFFSIFISWSSKPARVLDPGLTTAPAKKFVFPLSSLPTIS